MAPSTLTEFVLPIDLNTFITIFWSDNNFYEQFLTHQLEDLNVNVGEWTPNGVSGVVRQINSHHPSKISFPVFFCLI
jgi:hypothetical protein